MRGEQEGEQKNLHPAGQYRARHHPGHGRVPAGPAAMFEPYLHGQVMLLTAHYFNLLMGRRGNTQNRAGRLRLYTYNLGEDLSTTLVAKHAGTHKDALNKHFKEVYGKNVRQYITHVRLEEAEYRLLNTSELVWEIAAHTNLTDASHLVRLIRGKHGLTPEEYREKHK